MATIKVPMMRLQKWFATTTEPAANVSSSTERAVSEDTTAAVNAKINMVTESSSEADPHTTTAATHAASTISTISSHQAVLTSFLPQ